MNQQIIIVEGIDGVGKTTFCRKLKKINSERNFSSEVIPEFMEEFADGYITNRLDFSKFISLSDSYNTNLAQTFFLLSSHLFKYEVAIQKYSSTAFLIFDRFLFSVLAYQMVILEKSNHLKLASALYDFIETLLPNGLIVVYLSCEIQILEKRLARRSEEYDESDLEFLGQVSEKYDSIFEKINIPVVNIDTSIKHDDLDIQNTLNSFFA